MKMLSILVLLLIKESRIGRFGGCPELTFDFDHIVFRDY